MTSKKNSKFKDFEWAVKLSRFNLELIGLWPEAKQSTREKLMCNLRVFIAFVALVTGMLVPSVHSLIRIHSNMLLVIDNLQCTLPVIACISRILIFWWKKAAIVPIMNMIAEDWMKLRSMFERDIMIKWARRSRRIIICAFFIMWVGYLLLVGLPIFGKTIRLTSNITDPGRLLPLQSYYIYDVTERPLYELTYIFQLISVFFAVLPYTGIDNFLGLLVLHICGQLEILKNRLIQLHKYKNFQEALKSNVMDHIRLLRSIEVIENVYNVIVLVLFLYFGTLFALYGFLIITLLEEKSGLSISRLVFLIITVTNTFGHMCVYCAVGEVLVLQCNRIHYAAYSNKWYTLDSRNARNIILIMVKTSESAYLTAGKVFPLTMATFCNLIKTSAGYISVLHTTRN